MIYLLLLLPLALQAFTPHPVTPVPVLGYRVESFFDEAQNAKRELLIWYPVEPITMGTPSKDPWDVFEVAVNAPPAVSKAKMKVIVLSHGYTGNPHQLSWLIRGLVHKGFVVAAVQHRDLVEGKVHINHWQRAQDVGLIIHQLSMSSIARYIDLQKMGIAGFSLGGTTAVWVAGGRSTKLNTLIPGRQFASPDDFTKAEAALPTLNKQMMAKDWRNEHIKAAFIMAPAWAWLFDEESLTHITIPTYFIAPSNDNVLVTRNNAGFFARNIPRAIYQEIPGKATHYVFITSLTDPKLVDPKRELTFLFEDDPSINRRWIQFQVAEEAAKFFKDNLFDVSIRPPLRDIE